MFKPVAMVGGVQAIREPWRNTYAHLVAAMGRRRLLKGFPISKLFRDLTPSRWDVRSHARNRT